MKTWATNGLVRTWKRGSTVADTAMTDQDELAGDHARATDDDIPAGAIQTGLDSSAWTLGATTRQAILKMNRPASLKVPMVAISKAGALYICRRCGYTTSINATVEYKA
jgi:hypothetical protein